MDPYLEDPALWPDVHNRLITAIADDIAPSLAPRYYVRLERRTYLLSHEELTFIGRPDIAVFSLPQSDPRRALPLAAAGVVEVVVPMADEVGESYLEVHETATGEVVTVLEVLSPANKLLRKGREEYEFKRQQIFSSRTNLVEIDLLRAGKPMLTEGRQVASDYRILVSRASTRPRAHLYLYAFNLRDPLPTFDLPLLPGDAEPPVDLGRLLHALYARARYDLSIDYSAPPQPPLSDEGAAWAAEQIAARDHE